MLRTFKVALFLGGLLLCTDAWSFGDPRKIQLEVAQDGSYSVQMSGELWFVSSPFEVVVEGKRRSSADGTLVIASSETITGTDTLGAYTGLVLRWRSAQSTIDGGDSLLETAFLMAADATSLRFNTTFPVGVEGAGSDSLSADLWGTPSTAFPGFVLGSGKLGVANASEALGFVGYSEIGRPYTGIFPNGYKVGGNTEDGVPLLFVHPQTKYSAMLSPASKFYDTVFGVHDTSVNGGSASALKCGVVGTADSIPAGWQTQVILHYNNSKISRTVMDWGDKLLALHNKKRPGPTATVQVQRLGLSTVGHYFYGAKYNETFGNTLVDLVSTARASGLSIGYLLIDSMWYREGPVPTPDGGVDLGFGGTWRWDDTIARAPEMFPSGLESLHKQLGLPFVMHMGEWVGGSSPKGPPPYATNKSYDWVVEDKASIPRPGTTGGRAFWDSLFAAMSANGLTTYKLDHSQQQMPDMNYLLRTLGATAGWLKDMAVAAASHGVTKQYGGHISSGFLHSVELPNAFVARVSDDYIPGVKRASDACSASSNMPVSPQGNVFMGKNSLYAWAVGLVPYKDAFLSTVQHWNDTTCIMEGSYTKPEWWGLQEQYPELHVVVAALSAGPVGIGDGIGTSDIALITRTCTANGTLLKPDRPAFALDIVWENSIFGNGAASGEITSTGVSLNGQPTTAFSWHYVLGADVKSPVVVTASDFSDLDTDGEDATVFLWSRHAGDQWGPPVLVGSAQPLRQLELPFHPTESWGNFTLWYVAHVSCNGHGWTLLGETSKIVPVSRQRIVHYKEDCSPDATGIDLEVAGTSQETVELMFVPPNTTTVRVFTATINADGMGRISVSS